MRPAARLLALATMISLTVAVNAVAQEGALDQNLVNQYEKKLQAEGNYNRTVNALTNNRIKDLSLNREMLIRHDKLVSLKLKTSSITNQNGSGRCWMFAGVNVLAPRVMKKFDLEDFEMSQPYLTFWDKLEKANFFLERIIEMRDKPLDDRSLQLQLDDFFGDGGWWPYFTNLLDKYGMIPIAAMPETKQSVSTGDVNNLASSLLRRDAAELRQMHRDGKNLKQLRARKEEMLADIYKLLVYTYGTPPKEFTFRYEKKEDSTTSIVEETYTPQAFYRASLGDSLPEYVAIVNNPGKEYDQMYLLEASRNIYERSDFMVLNLPVEKLKDYTMKSLLDSQAVWFACDVSKDNYNDSGVFAVDIYDYNTTFNIDFKMSKENRITLKDISPNHAMTIAGIDTTAAGKPEKWLVKNSWGAKNGDDGFYYMYDEWFSEYVLVVVIDKKLLSEDDRAKLMQKPMKIADWEPFFSALRTLD